MVSGQPPHSECREKSNFPLIGSSSRQSSKERSIHFSAGPGCSNVGWRYPFHRINLYPADSLIDFRNTYPVGSAVSNVLNNRGQMLLLFHSSKNGEEGGGGWSNSLSFQ